MLRATLLVTFAAWVANILRQLGLFVQLPQGALDSSDRQCRIVPNSDSFHGSEDTPLWRDGQVVVSAGDLHAVFNHGAHNAHAGALFTVDLSDSEPVAEELTISGFPEELRFQPHGLYIERPHIYAVSHPGSESGSRVEVFLGVEGPLGKLVGVQWVRSVTHPLLSPNCSPNDVAVGSSPGEIYVTRWLAYELPPNGKRHPQGVVETLHAKAMVPVMLFGVPAKTGVVRCTFDLDDPEADAECSEAATGLLSANGITISTDKLQVFVNDLSRFAVTIYDRAADGSLTKSATISLPHAVDNVEYEHATGDLLMGSIPKLHECVAMDEAAEPLAYPVPGGLLVATKDPTRGGRPATSGANFAGAGAGGFVAFYDQVLTDGSTMSQVSAGARHTSAETGRTRVVLGSPFASGLLFCEDA